MTAQSLDSTLVQGDVLERFEPVSLLRDCKNTRSAVYNAIRFAG